MKVLHSLLGGLALGAMMLPMQAQALELNIQGYQTALRGPGTCVEIGGRYKGFSIESSSSSQAARACFSARRNNSLSLHHVTVVWEGEEAGDVSMVIQHDFQTGPQGVVYGRAELKGFFARANGIGAPQDNKLTFRGVFLQGGDEDVIGEEQATSVGEDLESALLKLFSRKEYLTSGRRGLRAELQIHFERKGDKLVVDDGALVTLDDTRRFIELVEDSDL